ncbi:MAG: hypothetical protein GXW99_07890 [Clostridiales bacterium]|nr:hypothetical protein [Clostridiales bacterium]
MTSAIDHTDQVERRVVAIPIKATDTCGFYKMREGALLPVKACWYCIHGDFQRDTPDPHQSGFCKFKK